MFINDGKVKKSSCEKYVLKFNDGLDWAIFIIDETGVFSCQSTFGDYTYVWSSFGESFKEFLIKLKPNYLYRKLCKKTKFSSEKYIESCKKQILKDRRGGYFNKEEAHEFWDFLENTLERFDSPDYTLAQIDNDSSVGRLIPDLYESEYNPNEHMEYENDSVAFVEELYPMFVNILKEELNK